MHGIRLFLGLAGLLIGVAVPAQTPQSPRVDEVPAEAPRPAREPAGPKIYRWVDSAGRVQFGSTPPPGVSSEAVRVREQSLGGEPAVGARSGPVPDDLGADGLDVVDRRNRTAPAPSYDWEAERPKRLAEHCGFIRERVQELRSGQEWVVLDWGKPPTRLDGPRRVEELVKRERLLRQHCQGH